eukprot:gene330-962_t
MSTALKIFRGILTGFIVFIFVTAGVMKLSDKFSAKAHAQMKSDFVRYAKVHPAVLYGYGIDPEKYMKQIGLAELAAATFLLIVENLNMNISARRKLSITEREQERMKRRQEVYMDAMKDLELLRNHYRDVLRSKLEEKVIKQREERDKRKAMINKQEPQENNKQKFSKVRLPRSEGVDDTKYLRNIPISRLYQIITIQNSMMKDNELSKKHKVDEFHRLMSQPDIFKKIKKDFKKGHQLTFTRLKELASVHHREQKNSLDVKSHILSPIPNNEEEPPKNLVFGKKYANSSGDQKAINLEEIFPTVSYPKLPMINRDLESPEPEQSQFQQSMDIDRKRRNTEQRKVQLARMFQKSVTYETATDRLMKKYKDFGAGNIAGDCNIKDFVETCEVVPLEMTPKVNKFARSTTRRSLEEEHNSVDSILNIENYLSSLPDLQRIIRNTELLTLDERDEVEHEETRSEETRSEETQSEEEEGTVSSWHIRAYSDPIIRDQILGRIKPAKEEREPSPLTMHALEETTLVKTVKGPSKYWVNPATKG